MQWLVFPGDYTLMRAYLWFLYSISANDNNKTAPQLGQSCMCVLKVSGYTVHMFYLTQHGLHNNLMHFTTVYILTCTTQPPGEISRICIILHSTQTSLTNTVLSITAELISIFTFTAESPRLVVADSMRATDLRIFSALINVWWRREWDIIC